MSSEKNYLNDSYKSFFEDSLSVKDPEPRLHIPIITNPGCIMVIDNVAKHMPADGSVWGTNNTKYHNAFNGGEVNRIHLVACVLDYKFN